ncbi:MULTISPECIES: ABC transporter ATP-binding protein [unclassified Streptomyces]|uniref:ABC transporter ATP-binding protein n=1 Tax=unclassified Streptomyces TaxID=2593676 RepID=UPI003422A276
MVRLRTGKRATARSGTRGPSNSGAPSPAAALTLDSVTRRYRRGGTPVNALDEVSVTVERGTFLAVMGRSGSGKTTFLQCSAGLDQPTSGTVRLGDIDLSRLTESALTRLRRERIGFVFQALNLVPSLSVRENTALPLLLAGERPDSPAVRERALQVLESVGLADRAEDSPLRLSGGQQQRVAIARALVTNPAVIFADEPTGALDPVTARDVLVLLRDAVDRQGHTVVMVTHDAHAASWTDEALFIEAGRIVGRLPHPEADTVTRMLTELREG